MSGRAYPRVAVVGGGVVGLAVAFEARRRGMNVTVVGTSRPGEATPMAGGMLAPAAEAEDLEPALLTFARRSCHLFPEFVEAVEKASGAPCGYAPRGTRLVALHRDHRSDLERLHGIHQALDIPSHWLNAAQLRREEPAITPRQLGALATPDDHVIDPVRWVTALTQALERSEVPRVAATLQALTFEGERATGLRVMHHGTPEHLAADVIVVAAGAWSAQLLPDTVPLPMRPVRGHRVMLTQSPTIHRTLRTPDVYLVPRAEGGLYLGATTEEVGFDADPEAGPVLDLLHDARAVVPEVYEARWADVGVGFRPALRDHLPAIGPTAVEGLWLATGHFRHGIMLAPATAIALVDSLERGVPTDTLAPFSPLRFARTEVC